MAQARVWGTERHLLKCKRQTASSQTVAKDINASRCCSTLGEIDNGICEIRNAPLKIGFILRVVGNVAVGRPTEPDHAPFQPGVAL